MAISNPHSKTGPTTPDLSGEDKETVENPEQTWVSAKDADGETQRIKSEDYPAWEAEQEQKRLKK